jgi:hypothetical protein
MMKYMMRFEKNIPVMVSVRVNLNSPAVAPLRWGSARPFPLLHLLGGLPEEKTGRNRGSQKSYNHRQESAGPLQMGHERHRQRVPPIDVGIKRCDYLGEQNERQPLEDLRD